ncbi:MAG: prepilin-type N-terminal cleavage/methylation domain-containing protein, partial [Cetobacterium sp.]
MKKNKKKGFSMIELVITVAVLAILVSMIGPVIR